MKVFLDANVLVSVLNHEYPIYTYSSRILSLSDDSRFKIYTSPLCSAIAFYFAEKKSGTLLARKKLQILSQKLLFTSVGPKIVEKTIQNKKIHDLEDGLEYYSALESGCECIITEDGSDFYFSEINVLTSRNFFESFIS